MSPIRLVVLGLLAAMVLSAEGSAARGQAAGNTPAVWQVSRWTVPQGGSVEGMLNAVAEKAHGYPHIVIAGDGSMADAMTSALLRQGLPMDVLSRVAAIDSKNPMPSASSDGKPTVVIRVTDTLAEPVSSNEQVVLDPDVAVSVSEYLRSTAALLRIGQGMLKDPGTIVDPIWRANAEKLQGIVGDWSTPEAKGILERWGKAIQLADWMVAGWHDVDAASQGKFQWQDSKVFFKVVHFGAEAGLTSLLKMLPSEVLSQAEAKTLGGSLGIGDLAEGVVDTIIHGDVTVDGWEHYLDATVAVTWTDVGWLVSGGNVRVAKCFSDVAVATAKAGRGATAKLIKDIYDRYFGTEIDSAFEEWQVEQMANARLGKPLVAFVVWANAAGFGQAAIDRKKGAGDEALYTCQRLEEAVLASRAAVIIAAMSAQPSAGNSNDAPGGGAQEHTPPLSINADDQRQLKLRQPEVKKKKPDIYPLPPGPPPFTPSGGGGGPSTRRSDGAAVAGGGNNWPPPPSQANGVLMPANVSTTEPVDVNTFRGD